MGDLSVQPKPTIYLAPATHSAERLSLDSKKSASSLSSGSSEGCLSSIWNTISAFFSSIWASITGLFSSAKSTSTKSKPSQEKSETATSSDTKIETQLIVVNEEDLFTLTPKTLDQAWKSFASQKRIEDLFANADKTRPHDGASALQFVWWVKIDETPVLVYSKRVNYNTKLTKELISEKVDLELLPNLPKMDKISKLEMHGMCIVRSCNKQTVNEGDFRFFHSEVTATAGVEDPNQYLKKFKQVEPVNPTPDRLNWINAQELVDSIFPQSSAESLDPDPKKEIAQFITQLKYR